MDDINARQSKKIESGSDSDSDSDSEDGDEENQKVQRFPQKRSSFDEMRFYDSSDDDDYNGSISVSSGEFVDQFPTMFSSYDNSLLSDEDEESSVFNFEPHYQCERKPMF
eukprot:gene6879-7413_t